MSRVNVGLKVIIMVVITVEEIILQTSVVNLTRSLLCPTMWPIHNNMPETTREVLDHKVRLLMSLDHRILL